MNNLMTYEEIYNKIRTDEGHRFTIYELIKIFQNERKVNYLDHVLVK